MTIKFKNTGRNLDEVRKRLEKDLVVENQNSVPIGIKTPLRQGSKQGETLFSMHFDIFDQIEDNLKNLIMTQKGERLGRPEYGTNIYKIYSNTNIENPDEIILGEISSTVSRFMPQIFLKDFESKKIENNQNDPVMYQVYIYYTVPALSNETRNISITIKMSN